MNKKILSFLIVVAIAALGFGIYSNVKMQQAKKNYVQNLQTATVLPQPRAIADFSLTDNQNQTYTNQNLQGHWTMFFFGFTSCGYVCPTTMAALKSMTQILTSEKIQTPQVILVSVHPERDTLAQINNYVTGFNPNFIGLLGTQQKIDALANNLNVLYIKIKSKQGNKNYDIDHSGTILLLNPAGQLTAVFSMPHDPKAMAHDFNLIQKYSENV